MNLTGKTVRFREAFNPPTPEHPDLQYDGRDDICSAILGATNEFSRHPSAPDDDRGLLVLRVTDDARADFSCLPLIY